MQIVGQGIEVFDYDNFPERLVTFYANSGTVLSAQSYTPRNNIEIFFDFKSPRVFDFSVMPGSPTPDASSVRIAGMDANWVRGVFAGIKEIVGERKSKRRFLHGGRLYDLLLWLVAVPAAFWICSLAAPLINDLGDKIHSAAIYAAYLYLFLAFLVLYRTLFHHARWIWLKVEYGQSSRSVTHRVILFAISTSIIARFLYDILRWLIR